MTRYMNESTIHMNHGKLLVRSGVVCLALLWGALPGRAADSQGTRNYMGAKDPAIDAMIASLLEAREHPGFVSAVRALDRTLISGFYAIPLFNLQEQWIARWNRIERPSATALTGYLPETWWHRPDPQPK